MLKMVKFKNSVRLWISKLQERKFQCYEKFTEKNCNFTFYATLDSIFFLLLYLTFNLALFFLKKSLKHAGKQKPIMHFM